MKRNLLYNLPVANVDMKEAVAAVEKILQVQTYAAAPFLIFAANPEKITRASTDKELLSILQQSDLLIPDGIGLVWASRLLRQPLRERVTGFDLMQKLIHLAASRDFRIFLLGSKPEVVEKAAAKLSSQYPSLKIAGYHHGYFDSGEEEKVIGLINRSQPDILFVGMGSPRQEKWLFHHRHRLQVKVAMGVGGSLDVISGRLRRAPLLFRRLGLEWFYRGLREPKRFYRFRFLLTFLRLTWQEYRQKNNPR
ncbi:MAG: N-acetylglucosaminyldiphosphoundecaprenol N-acetyl-beta-D-mannosaminyltransferase [Eubacteriales bacterium]|nr:N-acetylglucosaminyldiphosphoundecaprenol N-acetyl-beta-D-mannosaminyltransferase [Eubacteriales bacterium]MDN5364092.1 N-acetylglucosaminyldiphosphoundecaprenol N-acetyl-beta-D-mannosaminyltransferase [Eubacteriales bacterium]